MLAVGKDVGLEREERPARIDEIDTRKTVFERDLLGTKVLRM